MRILVVFFRVHSICNLLLIFFLIYPSLVSSETSNEMDDQSMAEKMKNFSPPSLPGDENNLSKEEASSILPDILCSEIDDEPTRDVCWKAYQSSLQYYDTGLEHRKKVFRWQHTSTIIIFIIVHLLVAIGVYFAWIQFKIDTNNNNSKTHESKNHSVEVSTSGIKVSSPVLGVIILTLSLAFFYLYLAFVYPITEIF